MRLSARATIIAKARFLIAAAALVVAAGPICGGAGAQARLTVANAGGALAEAERKAFYVPFAAMNAVQIREDSFNQELARIRSQVDTGNLMWDLVSTTAINAAAGCEEGLFARVDWAKHLDPKAFSEVGGPGECAMPYAVVSGGLTYDADRIRDGPRTWADFWNVARWPGKRGLLYRAEQTFEIALMADGVPPGKAMEVLAAPGGVERALRKLGELKPHIHWWKSGAESIALLASGEVAMAYAWNGRVAAANRANGLNLRMEFGAGHVSGSQYWAIMKGARSEAAATAFVKFAVSAEPQAEFVRRIHYAPANRDAYRLLGDRDKSTLPLQHMDKASLQQGPLYVGFWTANGDALLQRFVKFAAQ